MDGGRDGSPEGNAAGEDGWLMGKGCDSLGEREEGNEEDEAGDKESGEGRPMGSRGEPAATAAVRLDRLFGVTAKEDEKDGSGR